MIPALRVDMFIWKNPRTTLYISFFLLRLTIFSFFNSFLSTHHFFLSLYSMIFNEKWSLLSKKIKELDTTYHCPRCFRSMLVLGYRIVKSGIHCYVLGQQHGQREWCGSFARNLTPPHLVPNTLWSRRSSLSRGVHHEPC